MLRVATLVLLALLAAGSASAQSGVNFYLNDCGAGSSNHSLTNSCTSNNGSYALVVSVILPRDLPQFIGTTVHVGVIAATSSLPDWWKLDACRAGALSAVADSVMVMSCPTIWDARAPANVETYARSNAGMCPNQIGLFSSATLAAPVALVADGATELGVTKLMISKRASVGTGMCAGCTVGACIVLSQVELRQADGSVVAVTNPISNDYITYQTGSPTCSTYYGGGGCFETPVRNRTWGALKSLYR